MRRKILRLQTKGVPNMPGKPSAPSQQDPAEGSGAIVDSELEREKWKTAGPSSMAKPGGGRKPAQKLRKPKARARPE